MEITRDPVWINTRMDYKMIRVEINRPTYPSCTIKIFPVKTREGKSFSFVPPRFAYSVIESVYEFFVQDRYLIDKIERLVGNDLFQFSSIVRLLLFRC